MTGCGWLVDVLAVVGAITVFYLIGCAIHWCRMLVASVRELEKFQKNASYDLYPNGYWSSKAYNMDITSRVTRIEEAIKPKAKKP